MTVLISLLLLITLSVSQSSAADKVSDFYGTWMPVDQYASCQEPKPWAEGPHIEIAENHFLFGDGPPCEDVGQWMDDGKLRVSAACRNEGGIRNFNGELTLQANGEMTIVYSGSDENRDERPAYKRCLE